MDVTIEDLPLKIDTSISKDYPALSLFLSANTSNGLSRNEKIKVLCAGLFPCLEIKQNPGVHMVGGMVAEMQVRGRARFCRDCVRRTLPQVQALLNI